jgi:hypothetical protein
MKNLVEILKRFPHESTRSLCEEFNVSPSFIHYQAKKHGIVKTQAQRDSTRFKEGPASGIQYRFKKGNIPANKGKKMPIEVRLKVEKTMFKKGLKPHNTKPKGTKSIRKDKSGIPYLYIKMSDSNWVLYHRFIWEKHNGKIPKGYRIHFKDKNTMNCDIDNLILLSGKESMALNTIQRYTPELIEVIKVSKKLIKKINQKN